MSKNAKKGMLITGASGFVGSRLMEHLRAKGYGPLWALKLSDRPSEANSSRRIDLSDQNRLVEVLKSVDTIVHLAARVHVMEDKSPDPLQQFRQSNVEISKMLAEKASEAGVSQFIYISTAKVAGEENNKNASGCEIAFYEEQVNPVEDPYALSKWEAEQALTAIARQTSLKVTILRPPLVYGPGVGANFLQLIRLVDMRLPMPFQSISNVRSLISVDNLVDAITACIQNPATYNQTFFVDDGAPLSTPQLVSKIALHLDKTPRMFRFPVNIMLFFARILGLKKALYRLTGSFLVDSTKFQKSLNWQPPKSIDESLQETVAWYRATYPKG